MKPKRYITLKDLPDQKAGAVFEEQGEWIQCEVSNLGQQRTINYPLIVVERNPDWFQLIEEKEFTKSDMIEFAKFYWYSERNIADIKMDFQEWLTQRNNGK